MPPVIEDIPWESVLFSDEKLFIAQSTSAVNSPVVWVLDPSDERRFTEADRHGFCQVMAWGGISMKGGSPIVFVDEEGTVDQIRYIKMIKEDLLPWVQQIWRREEFIFMQDNAPAHKGACAKAFLVNQIGWNVVSASCLFYYESVSVLF